ncbi:MAG: GxGYxYP family putative glycoside hydrolase [Planctomycetota bacterium]|nr:GxGYxYP family putative glycoside hydrolase [Planctomycetota bacterium]
MLNSLSGVLLRQGNNEGVYTDNRQASRDILADIVAETGITVEWVSWVSNIPPTALQYGWEVMDHFKSAFGNRYILYDVTTNPDSMNAARMASYTYNCPIIDISQQGTATSHGLTVALDVRTYTDQWIYDNWWPTWPVKGLAVEQNNLLASSSRVFLNDVAAAMGAVCFYDAASTTLRRNFLTDMEDDSPVFGWPDFDELASVTEMSQRNTMLLGANYCANISMLTAFKDPSQWPIQQQAHSTRTFTGNKHYVSFMYTDGDNLQWLELDFPTSTEWWGSPVRGTNPIGWGIPLSLRDTGQNVVENLYNHSSTTQGKQDYFVAMGAGGYSYISMYSSAARADNATRTAKYMADMDLNILCSLDHTAFITPSIYDPYLQESAIDAIFYWDVNGDYGKYGGDILWRNNKPIISAYQTLWAGVNTPAQLATKLNARSTDPNVEGAYSLVPVHAWSYGVDDVNLCIKNLNSNVVVVTPEELVKLVKQNVNHTIYPTSYTVLQGTYSSGTVPYLQSNDNIYLVVTSSSVSPRTTTTDFNVPSVLSSPPSKITVSVITKASTSSTAQTIYLWNYSTSAWDSKDGPTTVGTSEVTRNISVTSNPSNYTSGGVMKIRVTATKSTSSSYTFSHEQIKTNFYLYSIYDLDCNGYIGLGDIAVMGENWLNSGQGDFNNDGIVNFNDFAELVNAW